MDRGHKLTDERIKEIEERLHEEYTQAAHDVSGELRSYMKAFELKDQKWQEWVANGKHTQAEYMAWRKQQLMGDARWNALKERLAQRMLDTNQSAQEIIASYMPDIMALNHNWALYDIEMGAGIDTALSIYNRESVGRILIDDPDLMPGPGKGVMAAINEGKAKRWEKQKVQSLMINEILTGKSIPKMASKMASELANGDLKASVRNCRTMATNAQNAGRYGAYRRVDRSGYDLTIEWAATLDMRTRHEHRMMHGQRRELDEPFEVDVGDRVVKILYPAQTKYGQSDIPQQMIWNCRCALIAWIKGFEHDTLKKSERMEGMSFEEWQNAKPVSKPILSQKETSDKIKADKIKEYRQKGSTTVDLHKTLADAYERRRVSQNLNMVPYGDAVRKGLDPISINLKNLDAKTRKTAENVINRLSESYDTNLTKIRTMTKQETFGNSAFATTKQGTAYTHGFTEMLINPIKCDYEKMVDRIKELRQNSYIPKIREGTEDQYIFTHEFAHTLINMQAPVTKSQNWVGLNLSEIRSARKEIEKIYDEYKQDVREREKVFKNAEYDVIMGNTSDSQAALKAKERLDAVRVSRYSLENSDEFMADCFAQVNLAEKHSPYAGRVVDVLDKYYGAKRKRKR